ncbi:MBL fold metallo-hydrolase [Sphingopyxis sp.]|uniref:MBL fold metallo-hydrolase n=1 Tax=Sphingopyxis sp. TaxID=1908224 RepID=UPI0035AF372B
MTRKNLTAGTAAFLSLAFVASASGQTKPVGVPLPETARAKIAEADRLAGDDMLLRAMRNYHCYYVDPVPAPFRPSVMETTDFLFGTRILDNVYYLGYLNLAAYAIRTPDGLVLVDAGGSEAHGRAILDWMTKAGFSPGDLKYIIVTHEHFDHFAGAPLLKAATGAKIVAGADAPFGDGKLSFPESMKPLDVSVKGRMTLKLGKTDIVLLPTPGHTKGTISVFAPVEANGQRHMASFWGGKGMRPNAASIREMIQSLAVFTAESEKLKVDVPLNTHSWGDATIPRIIDEILVPSRPNPFVLSADHSRKNLQILERCTSAYLDAVESGAITKGLRD